MAVATYNTDLTLLDNADTNIWVEPTVEIDGIKTVII